MAEKQQQSPFQLLLELENRSRALSVALPYEIETRERWTGLAFRIGDNTFVSPIHKVMESLVCPSLTLVPGAKPWMKGIANLRGELLPVVDLQGFLMGKLVTIGRRSRVMIISKQKLYVGLLVDEVLGLRHFFKDERRDAPSSLDDAFQRYVDGMYSDGGIHWNVFGVDELAEDNDFLHVSV